MNQIIFKIFTNSFLLIILCTSYFILSATPILAASHPLSVPNNKFGIHIISPTVDEASAAGDLVNSNSGDWGYITFLIESKDRNRDKWQTFFNELRRRHLIPLVRIATYPEGNYWKRPDDGEETAWADFLDSLNWPVKNRYVIIYNEPNQGLEWGGAVDAKSYALALNKTITALKEKNEDFFVLNAGFDAAAPFKPPLYQDQISFLKVMEETVPGIFNKLDGWSSHSYPNPGFVGSPKAYGKGSVRTYQWELEFLKNLGVTKNLPVFITETGWKHAEGLNYNKLLPTAEMVGRYFEDAFQNAWNDPRIVAITPFILDYQEPPFDHFSFKKITGKGQDIKILGTSFPDYYPHYQTISDLPKIKGQPVQIHKAKLTQGTIYSSLVAGEEYFIPLTFKNTGQSIWGEDEINLRITSSNQNFLSKDNLLSNATRVEPGQSITFNVYLKAEKMGPSLVNMQLYSSNQPFNQDPWEYSSNIKSPVILLPKVFLKWKKFFDGEYKLTIKSETINYSQEIYFNKDGETVPLEARFLLPDYNFEFTLERPFYKPKIITTKIFSGENLLDFGTLEPDLFSAMLLPKQLWQLLPFSN